MNFSQFESSASPALKVTRPALLAIAVVVAWALAGWDAVSRLTGAENAATSGQASTAERRADAKIISEMRAKIADLKRKIAASDDMAENLRLQGEARQIIEDTLPKLSSQGRATMVVSIKLVDPILTDGQAANQQMADFFGSPDFQFITAQSQDDLKARLARVENIAAANAALLQRIIAFDVEAGRVLEAEKIDPGIRKEIMTGLRTAMGQKLEQLQALGTVQEKLFARYGDALQMLHDEWGKWEPEGGMVAWQDSELLVRFEEITGGFDALVDEQNAIQEKLMREK